jgi:glutathione peroxidase
MGLVASLWEMFSRSGHVLPVKESIYDFKIKSLQGKEIDFNQFRSKPILIVNTASRCAYTSQYADLEKLHETYGKQVVILGFPANNFLWQEPGSNADIASFCQVNFGVTFPMLEKTSVVGKNKHPLYRWLEAKTGKIPTWNFCKYLVDKNGKDVNFYNSKVNPMDPALVQRIIQ